MNDSEKIDSIMEQLEVISKSMEQLEVIKDGMKQFDVINSRLDVLEVKQELMHKKLDNLVLDNKIFERSIKKEIKLLQDAQDTLIEVLTHKGILPVVM